MGHGKRSHGYGGATDSNCPAEAVYDMLKHLRLVKMIVPHHTVYPGCHHVRSSAFEANMAFDTVEPLRSSRSSRGL